ncbi:hypothetical protein AB1Y20_019831 [Prymnesium parvum]|uniref:Sodium/calcium exchanger membrane region domain-containing protein n=1 Tax=Prymnesium parvum TaxID=97485 RepID=A0AB34JSY1_PRYPA
MERAPASEQPLMEEGEARPSRKSITMWKNAVQDVQRAQKMRSRGLTISRAIPTKKPPHFIAGSRAMLASNRLYWLLLTVPLALIANALDWPIGVVFGLSCAAILPLAGLLGEATEQVAIHTSEVLSGLLNATFGNATELIVAIFALQHGLLTVVSLLGSILSNTLLVLGCACLAGGIRTTTPKFNKVAAISNATLLQIAVLGLLVPTLLDGVGQLQRHDATDLQLSRGISIGLFILYILYIYFQLFTHRNLFEDDAAGGAEDDDGEEDPVYLTLAGGCVWLAVVTVLIALLSEQLTTTLEGAAAAWHLGEAFVGFVLLPIAGNAAEHSTAVTMAYKGKMDVALGVALGSSTQIALFVIPVMVLLGWVMDQPLDLQFGLFETCIVFMSSLIVFFIVQNGETNWLEGVMLLFSYCIICFAFFFFETSSPA